MIDKTLQKPQVQLPEPSLRRLPWYLAYVSRLRAEGVEFVSSTAMARELNVDASKIAKDLSLLSIKGKTRIGYEVVQLERELRDFLGFDTKHRAVIIGAGSLGMALIRDNGLHRYGLEIKAAIDVDPMLIGAEIAGVRIFSPEKLAAVVRDMDISIAIITVPVDSAQAAADHAVEAGIRALWNFTPRRILAPENIVVTNTSIYSHLAVMFNRLNSSHD